MNLCCAQGAPKAPKTNMFLSHGTEVSEVAWNTKLSSGEFVCHRECDNGSPDTVN